MTIACLAVCFVALASSLPAAEQSESADWKIHDYVTRHRQEMRQVTKEPYHVEWWGAQLCGPPNDLAHSPHGEHWIHVLVSPSGTNALVTGKGTHPEGTIILKQKFLDAAGTKTDFYTGMRKRERGYNPEAGDWEFFTLDARTSFVTARGKIESCMDCHKNFKSTDYVSRRYLTEKEAARR